MKAKRLICLFLLLGMLGSLWGCRIPGEIWHNPNLEEFCIPMDVMIGDGLLEEWHENNVITRVNWQKLRLDEDAAATYPALDAAFKKYNTDGETEAKALMYEFSSIAKHLSGDEYNPAYCEAEAKLYLQRADKNIVSFLESIYQHTGGVHPNYFWNGRNYDPETGKEMLLTDVLQDASDLPSILEKKLTEEYSEVEFFSLQDTFSRYKPEDFTWTMDYDGITFWFSPYELASYAVGTLSVKLWFDEHPDLFREDFTLAPRQYAIELPHFLDMDFDFRKDDGKRDAVYTETVLDDYGSYNMLCIMANGDFYTDEVNYAYYFDVYLVHTETGTYIYADSVTDNDYHMLTVLDVGGEKVTQIGQYYGTGFCSELVEDGTEYGTVYRHCFNDPYAFRLACRFDILGTRFGTAWHKLDENGLPQNQEDAFNIEGGYSITSVLPLQATLLSDKSVIELPAGTVFSPLRTDGETYIDMETDSGQEIRFSYDKSQYPWTVNGVSEYECFEFLPYAG